MSETPATPDTPITPLLRAVREGEPGALEALHDVAHDRLVALARQQRRRWQGDPTLDTAGLVSETYMKLRNSESLDWEDRRHFFAVAATAMRQILVSHARAEKRQKRGGGAEPVELHDAIAMTEETAELVLSLNDAMERLQEIDPRASRVVELHFLAGLTWGEVAEVIGVSAVTVRRDWLWARAWLRRQIEVDLGLSEAADGTG